MRAVGSGMNRISQAAKAEDQASRPVVEARETWPVRLAGTASELADQPPLVALSVATAVAGTAMRRQAVVRAGFRMLVAHALATGIKSVLKNRIDRTRPAKAAEERAKRAKQAEEESRGAGSS